MKGIQGMCFTTFLRGVEIEYMVYKKSLTPQQRMRFLHTFMSYVIIILN